jgi:uncharacterized protein (TIRG00374 family)
MHDASKIGPKPSLFTGDSKMGRGLIIFILLVVVGLTLSGWREALAGLSSIGIGKLALLFCFASIHYIVRAIRWHLLVRAGHVDIALGRNFLFFLGGFAMTATPGRIGELVRLRWLCRHSGQGFGMLLPIVFADRAVELAAMVLLIILCLMLVSLQSGAVWVLLVVASLLVWVICRPALLEAALGSIWWLSGKRFSRLFVKLRRMARRLTPFMKPGILVPAVGLGVLGWAFEGVAFYYLLVWLEVDISVWAASAIFLIAILSGALSGLPGGLGGTEASAVALLLLQGVSIDTAILATLIIRVTTLWFAVFIGIITFPIAETMSGKQKLGHPEND